MQPRSAADHWPHFSAAVIGQTSTHPLGHIGPVTRSLHLHLYALWEALYIQWVGHMIFCFWISKLMPHCRAKQIILIQIHLVSRVERSDVTIKCKKSAYNSYVYWTVHHLDSWIKIDQLDVTCFIISLFTAQHVSNVSTSIFRSLRLTVDLFHALCCSGSMCVGVLAPEDWCTNVRNMLSSK